MEPNSDSIQALYERLLKAGATIVVHAMTMENATRLAMTAKTYGAIGAHVVFRTPLVFGSSGVEILAGHAGRHATFDFTAS